MTKTITLITALFITAAVYAEDENNVNATKQEQVVVEESQEVPPKPVDSRRKSFKKRHLKLMQKSLDEIGVTEEQREKIFILQDAHMDKMKENWIRLNKARRLLSELQEKQSTIEELETAVQEVGDAQTEQLRILVTNRREMELILGKKKSSLLMKKAQEYFNKHNRRPGEGIPPKPGADNKASAPPVPPGS